MRGSAVTNPGTMVERRCEVLLGLATREDERGHLIEARELFAAALCEARRSDRPELLRAVRRACAGGSERGPTRRRRPDISG